MSLPLQTLRITLPILEAGKNICRPMAEEKTILGIKTLPLRELASTIRRNLESSEIKFTFLLGSGASLSSGIPTGGTLATKWYKELENDLEGEESFEEWKASLGEMDDKEHQNPSQHYARHYASIYEKRFGHIPQEGYQELKEIMEGKDPFLGYFILAKIITETHNNIVITTNFDSLVEDAIRSYTDKTPFVAGHEQLAAYVTSHVDRPIIIKLHRDLLLKPFNTRDNTNHLMRPWRDILRQILSTSTLIVLGYGGYDGSLMEFLKKLNPSQRQGIYWCLMRGDEPNEDVRGMLRGVADRIVEIDGFDEFMCTCALELGYKKDIQDVLTVSTIDQNPTAQRALRRFRRMGQEAQRKLAQDGRALEEMPKALIELLPEDYKASYEILLKVRNEKNLDKAEKIYSNELQTYSRSNTVLIETYALFLYLVDRNLCEAGEQYLKALKIESFNADLLNHFARFLESCKMDNEAEQYYKKALKVSPRHVDALGNYALFLQNVRKDMDEAERLYERAVRLAPSHASNLGRYAYFLESVRENDDKAERYYLKAIEANSKHADNLGNYAHFLENIRRENGQVEKCYKEAIEVDDNHSDNLGSYAHFLEKIDRSDAEVVIFLTKAIDAHEKRNDRSFRYDRFLKIISSDPSGCSDMSVNGACLRRRADNLGYYAYFEDINKDCDKAKKYYLEALEIDPKHINNLRSYAIFLRDVLGEKDEAENYFKKVAQLEQEEESRLEEEDRLKREFRRDRWARRNQS